MRGDDSFDMRLDVRLGGARLFEGLRTDKTTDTAGGPVAVAHKTGARGEKEGAEVMGVDDGGMRRGNEGRHVTGRGGREDGDKARINAIGCQCPRKEGSADPGPSPPGPSPASALSTAGESPSDPPSHKPSSIAHPLSVPLSSSPPPSLSPSPPPKAQRPPWTTTAAPPLDVSHRRISGTHPAPTVDLPNRPPSGPITPTVQTFVSRAPFVNQGRLSFSSYLSLVSYLYYYCCHPGAP
ncbi:hypothetical protein LXA43DRAFT_56146 [Ganoderma leucocontextum]|nr:hypothetical protein LXA43DRAFT_56146 [Ganoderma leucocontextum]